MTIQKFIDKAIEGGWTDAFMRANPHMEKEYLHENYVARLARDIERVLLDPEAWKAMGKVEGWGPPLKVWLMCMHGMIDALAEGKTIEQYLETL